MVYVPHTRLTAGGTLGAPSAPVEEWSCTLNFPYIEAGPALNQAKVDDAFDAWSTLLQNQAMKFLTVVTLRYVKAGVVDANGHIPGTVFRHDGVQSGATELGGHPFQCSVAVSLRTPLRGPSHRGRIFLPPQGIAIEPNDGEIPATLRNNMEPGLTQFFTALQTELGAVQIASSKGYNTEVTGYNVGRVFDTQRRRRRSLAENYEQPVAI